ncbi:hypothetical protein MKX01_003360 [Papaver californicum]|nr:hypothetical protein MKX01_003360 [Papaver californicum]
MWCQLPLYGIEGRFERINQHPDAGTHSFSIGITEVLNTNILIDLSAGDIEYVYQRSPGKILTVTIPTFEALTQFGVATVITKNIAILKDSDFNEVDRAECQFTTTATILDNGSQTPFVPPKSSVKGIFKSIESIWKNLGDGVIDFVSGKTCRSKCSGFFDFSCHIQYICMSWVVLFGLLLSIIPTVMVLLWLLHQKGFFDPFYDWWDDHFKAGYEGNDLDARHTTEVGRSHIHHHKYHKHEGNFYGHHTRNKRRSSHHSHHHVHPEAETGHYLSKHDNQIYHPHRYKFKHERRKRSARSYLKEEQENLMGY